MRNQALSCLCLIKQWPSQYLNNQKHVSAAFSPPTTSKKLGSSHVLIVRIKRLPIGSNLKSKNTANNSHVFFILCSLSIGLSHLHHRQSNWLPVYGGGWQFPKSRSIFTAWSTFFYPCELKGHHTDTHITTNNSKVAEAFVISPMGAFSILGTSTYKNLYHW